MKTYRRSDYNNYKIRFGSTNRVGAYSLWEGLASDVNDAIMKCKAILQPGDKIAFIKSMTVDGVPVARSTIVDINGYFFGDGQDEMHECDAGAAGGDAGGGVGAGDAGATADAGDSAADFTGITTTEVLGKNEPGQGFFGKDNFYIPSRVIVPMYRWEIANGGSRRKKDKNGKLKKTPYEKGMKVVVDMLSEVETDAEKEKLKDRIARRMRTIHKSIKSIADVNRACKKFEQQGAEKAEKMPSQYSTAK